MQGSAQVIDIYAASLPFLEYSLSSGRLDRYMISANNDRLLALKLYVWNANVCEAFYVPLKFAEVITRNAVLPTITAKYGQNWYLKRAFTGQLMPEPEAQLNRAIRDEAKQHGPAMTGAHVASGLNFGFWDHLTTKRYDHLLWKNGIHQSFPNAPPAAKREDLRNKIERVRLWRNRIAHYKSIFDKNPVQKHNEILELIGWVCQPTRDFVKTLSRVTKVIGDRPK
jgi:hypothetical protein